MDFSNVKTPAQAGCLAFKGAFLTPASTEVTSGGDLRPAASPMTPRENLALGSRVWAGLQPGEVEEQNETQEVTEKG